MASLNEDKIKQMQDEMSRFEEEIGLPLPETAPPPPPPPIPSIAIPGPKVISTNTYNEAQKQLAGLPSSVEAAMGMPALGVVPPPPPPIPPLPFIPHQVRGLPPRPLDGSRPPMDWRGPMPPVPPMPPGPMPSGPLPPPPGFGMMGPMGPPHMGPPGPMGPGPMGPGHLGPGPMTQAMAPPPPVPPMGPGPGGLGPPMMPPSFNGAAFPPHLNPPRFAPPTSQENKPQQPVQTVLSATPMMYVANPQLEIAAIQAESQNTQVSLPEIPMEDPKKNVKKSNKSQEGLSNQVTNMGGGSSKKDKKKNKKLIRTAGGQTWEDPTLGEWEDDDFRLFCGDLGNDVTDEVLTRAFSKYPSFLKARVVRDKRTNKTKGFGFVSFKDPQDFIRATKEMNGK
ncbi:unnamed protein product [Nezara viridula]|uniref:RNA-binding protein 42 n=1 Tax=Nezara viridula TaxID=85310 RepID=A0A9P0HKZ0_NEZVI|nr:unnamed protein product [Nezara viridula]